MGTGEETTFWQIVFSPAVLLTVLICLVLAGAVIWLLLYRQRRVQTRSLSQQREQQESTVDRLLRSFGSDKDALVHDYEARLAEKDARIASLERENSHLRDRLTSTGIMGVFGGGKREVVSALLLENEQLHELLAQKQAELRDLMSDLSTRLVERMDEQAQESARAVRYKQALLSAFLQQQETRQLLDRLIADGRLSATPPANAEQAEPPAEAPHS